MDEANGFRDAGLQMDNIYSVYYFFGDYLISLKDNIYICFLLVKNFWKN